MHLGNCSLKCAQHRFLFHLVLVSPSVFILTRVNLLLVAALSKPINQELSFLLLMGVSV